jgi:uncharacterized protein (TIGR00252 family)
MSQVRGMGILHPSFKKSRLPSTLDAQAQEESKKNKEIGDAGEKLAAAYLKGEGFQIVAHNLRFRCGEIDLIAARRRDLYFFEVKTRTSLAFVHPFEVITPKKQDRMRKSAALSLQHLKKQIPDLDTYACYYGVIGIDFSQAPPSIECLFDAFI